MLSIIMPNASKYHTVHTDNSVKFESLMFQYGS